MPVARAAELLCAWSALWLLLQLIGPIDCMPENRMPRMHGHAVSQTLISTRHRRVQNRLVQLHDMFRTKVRPAAANMLSMKWHTGAARNAQRWAERCQFMQHDRFEDRAVPQFDQCGQNIFVSTQKVPWLFVLRSWFIEHQNFTYGSPHNDPVLVGHYTQMVWAATHRVGCAVAKCARGGPRDKPFYNYVCDYCPAGNYPHKLAVPYKAGAPCSACRSTCKSHRLKLCTNACPVADNYSNCRQLYKRSPDWLCGADGVNKYSPAHNSVAIFSGSQRDKCLATCTCQRKIYD